MQEILKETFTFWSRSVFFAKRSYVLIRKKKTETNESFFNYKKKQSNLKNIS